MLTTAWLTRSLSRSESEGVGGKSPLPRAPPATPRPVWQSGQARQCHLSAHSAHGIVSAQFTTSPRGWDCCDPHCADKETEAQRGWENGLGIFYAAGSPRGESGGRDRGWALGSDPSGVKSLLCHGRPLCGFPLIISLSGAKAERNTNSPAQHT